MTKLKETIFFMSQQMDDLNKMNQILEEKLKTNKFKM